MQHKKGGSYCAIGSGVFFMMELIFAIVACCVNFFLLQNVNVMLLLLHRE